jgi:hypothetical protein
MKAYAYFQKRDGSVTRVAEINVPAGMETDRALEHVYCLLQNIRGSWSFGPNFEGCLDEREGLQNLDYSPNVKFVGKHPVEKVSGSEDGVEIYTILGERSMMIGDLITFDGKTYEVAPFGFEEYKEAA